ncbi:hypothetical protein AMS68_005553 [Peltaster fructicola]|uniref:Serine aminopeptidase S33 domain-containing protein n=1 Tax=Peltaster fructicola TaxID=286661 RepID=A0A6H0XZC9_9PEZI|nr:hypothetical protein AMS68_005553 [Peltaster fructicola]
MSQLWGYTKYPFYFVSGLLTVAGSALYYYQNDIIYPRNVPLGSRTDVPKPSRFAVEDYEEISLPTPDGETLSSFLIRPANPSQAQPVTILMLHGNAGNIGHRVPIAKVLANEYHCTVFMLEYRGYGLSTGIPTEAGLVIDSQTGLDYLRSRKDLADTKLVVYGQSIGGAVAIDLVSKNQEAGDIAGLILENTFLSIAKMIPAVMPAAKYLIPLCHEYWRSELTIPKITKVPILFLSGLRDEIVPPSHMLGLFKLARSKAVMWKELPNGDHNSTVIEPGYFAYIEDFLRRYVYPTSTVRL